ncbi:MAG: hypothetical protein U0R68_05115 [Candidatus Nanopelagicales bacterium]
MNARTLRVGLASAALLGLSAVTLTGLASSALFTDSKSTSAAAITSGNVALTVGGTASTALAVSAMAPGDTKYAVVSVANSGSLALRYSGVATWSAAGTLPNTATLSMRTIASSGATCDGTLSWGTGDVVTNAKAASTSATSVTLFGSSSAGAQTGDRNAAAAATDYFCVRLALPSSADNTVAGQTSNLTLSFDAEQTANNP